MNEEKSTACFVGIDVSKHWFDVYVHPEGKRHQFPMGELKAAVSRIQELSPQLVVLETTGGYEVALLRALVEVGVPVVREHAYRIHHHAKARGHLAKTDRLDAKVIAHYAACYASELKPSQVEANESLRALASRRLDLVRMRTAEKNRIQQSWESAEVEASCRRMIEVLEQEIRTIEAHMEKCLSESELGRIKTLKSVPGIGDITAMMLEAYLPELGRLNRKQISALAGVVPYHRESGLYKGQSKIRFGRSTVRNALYMSTITAVQRDERFKAFYHGLLKRGKPKKVALTACMHKMVRILNALLKSEKTYQHAS